MPSTPTPNAQTDPKLLRIDARRVQMQLHKLDERSLLSVITRLPPEIIIQVVEAVFADLNPAFYWMMGKRQILRLMHVCVRWRDIIANTPKFWTTFAFGTAEASLYKPVLWDIWMARSAKLPITVYFGRFYNSLPEAEAFAEFIIPHLHRCRDLILSSETPFLPKLMDTRTRTGILPRLSRLDIAGYLRFDHFFAVLQQCPNLKIVKAQLDWTDVAILPKTSPIITLPLLHTLDFSLDGGVDVILDHLDLPALRTLTMGVISGWSSAPLTSLLLRSKCPLQDIFLVMSTFQGTQMDTDIIGIFAAAPFLRNASFAGRFSSAVNEETLVRLTRPRTYIEGNASWQDIAPCLRSFTLHRFETSSESQYSTLLDMIESRSPAISTHLVSLRNVYVGHSEDLLRPDLKKEMYSRWRILKDAGMMILVEDNESRRSLLDD